MSPAIAEMPGVSSIAYSFAKKQTNSFKFWKKAHLHQKTTSQLNYVYLTKPNFNVTSILS
jgi:hypothetical protein